MPDRYCLLCGNRNKSDSYYSFPINQEFRKQWLSFCGIDDTVLNTVTKLCSKHFKEEDIIPKARGTKVKPDAVPCIMKTKSHKHYKKKGCKDVIKKVKDNNVNVIVNGASSNNVGNGTAYQGLFECVGVKEEPSVLLEETCTTLDQTLSPSNNQTNSCAQTPIKYAHPLYICDIRTPWIEMPRKAEKSLELAKRIISRQQRQIKSLHQDRNGLISRVRTMEAIVKCLKKQNLILKTGIQGDLKNR